MSGQSDDRVISVGDRYGLWIFDDSLYVRFEVTEVGEHGVRGRDLSDGNPVAVGLKRLAGADRLVAA